MNQMENSNSKKQKRKWSKKKKGFLIAGVVFVVVLVLFFLLLSGGQDNVGPVVVTSPLEQKDIVETLTLKAPLEGTQSVEVVSQLHAEIKEIYVKEGDVVEKGQVLAVLDSESMQDAIEQASDALDLATKQYQEKLESDQAAYDQAAENLRVAQASYDRTKALYDEGAETLANLETAENALAAAKQQVAGYNVQNGKVQGDASAQKQLEMQRKELADRQKDFADAEIKSPISGTVTRVNVNVGRFADDTEDNKPMFIIEDMSQLRMEVMVSEYDIGKIQEGQQVNVTADILGEESVSGVVARISPTGEVKDATSTERVIPTEIQLTGHNDKLIAGITAKAEIVIAQANGALVVPLGALIQNPDQTIVVATVTEQNTVHLLPVTVGLENDLEAQIEGEGLSEGMQVIVNPPMTLTEGMPVSVPSAPVDGE